MLVVDSGARVDGQELNILVEIDEAPVSGADIYEDLQTRGERTERVISMARDVFGEGLELARNCATRVAHSIADFDQKIRPDEVEVQIAIKLEAEAGAVLTKVGAGAQMQVSMKWIRSEES